jgi:hypothetical protein
VNRLAVMLAAAILGGMAGAPATLAAPPTNDGGPPMSPLDVAATPATFNLTVDSTGGFTADGAAVISGTLDCSPTTSFVGINVQVTQRVGRFTLNGFGSLFANGCPTEWAIAAPSSNGIFRGGRVQVRVFAFGCDFFGCTQVEVNQAVRLAGKVQPPVSPPISPPISPPVTDPVSPPVSDPVSPPVSQLAAALMSVLWLDPAILIAGVFVGVIMLAAVVGAIAARRTRRQLRLLESRQSG